MQNSEVFGSCLILCMLLGESGNIELVWGGDYNQECSDMLFDVFDLVVYDVSGGLVFDKIGKFIYMLLLCICSVGVFVQLQYCFDEYWLIDGGLCYEYFIVEFDDFILFFEFKVVLLVIVKGGDFDYDVVLLNFGIVYLLVVGQEIYVFFSQGFQLFDVGIQLCNVCCGFDIGLLNFELVKINNYEFGWCGVIGDNILGSLVLFYIIFKLGDVQSFNNGLIFICIKECIYGVEVSVDWFSDDEVWGVGSSVIWMCGCEKLDGKDWQDMIGYCVLLFKLIVYL